TLTLFAHIQQDAVVAPTQAVVALARRWPPLPSAGSRSYGQLPLATALGDDLGHMQAPLQRLWPLFSHIQRDAVVAPTQAVVALAPGSSSYGQLPLATALGDDLGHMQAPLQRLWPLSASHAGGLAMGGHPYRGPACRWLLPSSLLSHTNHNKNA
ncbi:hypothetical protein GW17_00053952, partial [Ensete ventricosum]